MKAVRSISVAVLSMLFLAAAGMRAEAESRILLKEDYEEDLDKKVQIHEANQPYDTHTIGVTTEKAHSGKHSLKVDATHLHALYVYLAPRFNEAPQVEWGRLGGPGTFTIDGLNISLKSDRGYILTLYVWVEKASPKNSITIQLETVVDTDSGVIRTTSFLDEVFLAPTEGWVKVEEELTSFLIEQLDWQGAKTEGLRLNSINICPYALSRNRRLVFGQLSMWMT